VPDVPSTTDLHLFLDLPPNAPNAPGIYQWEISGVGTYIGKSKNLRRRLAEYPNNVRKLLRGLPYRNNKPSKFRRVHRELATALTRGTPVNCSVVAHCDADSLAELERHWIAKKGTLNGRDKRVEKQAAGMDLNEQSPFDWQRGRRSSFALDNRAGVYALFLHEGANLPGIRPGENGLLYIGLAASRTGLKGRCHFDARTRNHSPRKSLAVLLMDELQLKPVLITKPNSSDTWGLDAPSDARLSKWMHDNLDLAIETCVDPDGRETELVGRHSPPLNLTKCSQTARHRHVSEWRARVMAGLQARQSTDTD
jgi:hypothetical protein